MIYIDYDEYMLGDTTSDPGHMYYEWAESYTSHDIDDGRHNLIYFMHRSSYKLRWAPIDPEDDLLVGWLNLIEEVRHERRCYV